MSSWRASGRARASAYVLLTLAAGCGIRPRARTHEQRQPDPAKDAEVAIPATVPEARTRTVVIDAADPNARCVFGNRGAVVDLSNQGDDARFGFRLKPPPIDWVEREGTRWAEVRGKSLSVDFFVVLPSDVTAEGPFGATPFVEARVRGGAAKTISFYLNGRAIGGGTLARGQTRVLAIKSPNAQPFPGHNELTVRLSGLPRGSTDPSVELDWVHFGVGEPDPAYSAPTQEDTRVRRSFGGQPERAISLRGPGYERCEGWIPSDSVVATRARLEGSGAADAEIRVIRDRVPPTVIGTIHLEATDAGAPRLHEWPVGDLGSAGTLAAVELSVVRASKGARVVFGEPRVLAPAHPEKTKGPEAIPARGVVLVVMSELGAQSLAPYGGPLKTPALTELASSGFVFDDSRATTGIAGGAVGSMVTGLLARDLGLSDGDSRLPLGVTTVADAVRQAGIASAFFTANPLTSAAFGFERGWSHFESHGPTEEVPATRVFDAAASWLGDHRGGRFLLVVHARGGHPPWDLSLDRVKALPPENYTGGLEAKRAAELLGRGFRTPGSYRFEDADRARAWALYGAAMEDEDAAFGRLVTALKSAGAWDDVTVVVTSDVGINEAARIPFAESESLDEAALRTPLILHWAHDPRPGAHVAGTASGEDVATTLLAAFGLSAPATFRGQDLRGLTDETGAYGAFARRARLATDQERFALRWGNLVSSGSRDREAKLCDLSLEPACVTDVRETYPLASRLLHAALYDDLVRAKTPFAREPASIDPSTLAALKAWGR